MNFLGHLYFSQNNHELMYGNIYGDFVKGSNLDEYTEITKKGIRLHREIDFYIDNHPKISKLRHVLSEDLPKINGIAIDLFFDHALAKYWKSYHPAELNVFINNFHNYPFDKTELSNSEFLYVIKKMKEGNWIFNYQYKSGLEFACVGLSSRISFENKLWYAPEVYKKQEDLINRTFHDFMTDAIRYFKSFHAVN